MTARGAGPDVETSARGAVPDVETPARGAGPDVETPYPGIVRRTFDGAGVTLAEYTFEPSATFPLHCHRQEQIVVVRRGELRLTIAGVEQRLGPGEWSLIASGVDHGITAANDGADFLAILAPRRERGESIALAPGSATAPATDAATPGA